jgi:hypothetical protein
MKRHGAKPLQQFFARIARRRGKKIAVVALARKLLTTAPRQFSRGNLAIPGDGRATYPASMGPRQFSRGNHREAGQDVPEYPASMGPRQFSRGNVIKRGTLGTIRKLLQWGRGNSAAEIAEIKPFDTTSQWWALGRGNSAAEIATGWPSSAPPGGFNGAAAIQPRK